MKINTAVVRVRETTPSWTTAVSLMSAAILVAGSSLVFRRRTAMKYRSVDKHRDEERGVVADRRIEEERGNAVDAHEDATLDAYLTYMAALMLDKGLTTSLQGDIVRDVARTQTLTVLRRLSPARQAIVLMFLYDADLIQSGTTGDGPIVDLRGCDMPGINLGYLPGIQLPETNLEGANGQGGSLEGADLEGAILAGANLTGTILDRAVLRHADLEAADVEVAYLVEADLANANLGETRLKGTTLKHASLRGADLTKADLDGAILSGADLSEATLTGANLTGARGLTDEQLQSVRPSRGVTLPDGSIRDLPLPISPARLSTASASSSRPHRTTQRPWRRATR